MNPTDGQLCRTTTGSIAVKSSYVFYILFYVLSSVSILFTKKPQLCYLDMCVEL